jgi:hypothetical protein
MAEEEATEKETGATTPQHFRDVRRSKRSVAIEDPGGRAPVAPRLTRTTSQVPSGWRQQAIEEQYSPSLASGFDLGYAYCGALKTPTKRPPLPSDLRFFCALLPGA